ncbi:hypothetical protein B0H11DRAFT_2067133 [Mycena galericulata]|nr:hypothetical protein B0H11DRAFT_2067133 [Mycena galericulata]
MSSTPNDLVGRGIHSPTLGEGANTIAIATRIFASTRKAFILPFSAAPGLGIIVVSSPTSRIPDSCVVHGIVLNELFGLFFWFTLIRAETGVGPGS